MKSFLSPKPQRRFKIPKRESSGRKPSPVKMKSAFPGVREILGQKRDGKKVRKNRHIFSSNVSLVEIVSFSNFVSVISLTKENLPRGKTFTISNGEKKVDGCFPVAGGYLNDIFLCEKNCRDPRDGFMPKCFKRDDVPKYRISLNEWRLVKGALY